MRGHYGFGFESDYGEYIHLLSVIIHSLVHDINQDGIELTFIDICPAQVRVILEDLGWERYEVNRDRHTVWEYYYHEDYPKKSLSLITDIDLFSMTIDVVDMEEEE